MRRRLLDLHRLEHGQAILEFALVLPVLLLLLFGLFDGGRAINYWNDETNLANIGARYAAVGSISDTSAPCGSTYSNSIVSYLECEAGQDSHELEYGNGSGSTSSGVITGANRYGVLVCVYMPSGDTRGQPVTVTVSTNYNWIPVPAFLDETLHFGSVITGSATMRIENEAGADLLVSSQGCPSSPV